MPLFNGPGPHSNRAVCKALATSGFVYRPISAIAERLDSEQFFRASRSWIINTEFIESIELAVSGGFDVKLKSDLEVSTSKHQGIEFRRLWSL